MRSESIEPLKSCIGDLADFVRVEILPTSSMEALVEAFHMVKSFQIDKSIAHIAFVLEVNRQVQEIVLGLVRNFNSVNEKLFVVLVGDVLYHE